MSKSFLLANEVAKATGVSTDTLRHYERKGVLEAPRRSHNGYREYPHHAIDRVRLIQRALGVGFTLDELARFLKVRDRGGAPCRDVRAMAARKLLDLETRLEQMILVRNELRSTLKDWDARLAKTASGDRAALLDALADSQVSRSKTSARFSERWQRKTEKERRK